jgi:integrase
MAVYDRWHLSHPPAGAEPCRCSRGKTKLYPNPATHEKGLRWQVRWDVIDPDTGKRKQPRRNFAKKEGTDPERCADAFDAKIRSELNTGTYVDPAAGARTFKDYAEEVLDNRAIEESTRIEVRMRFNKHIYPAIGAVELRVLARRPSRIQAIVRQLERANLDAGYIKLIVANVSMVFGCAVDDELIAKNPCDSKSVTLPQVVKKKITPWTGEQVAAVHEQLPDQLSAMVYLGAGLGLRQGEIFALSPDDVDWLSTEPVVHVQRQVKIIKGRLGMVFAPPKGQKIRTVPLPDTVKVALAEHMRRNPPASVTLPWRVTGGEPRTVRLFFPHGDAPDVTAIRRDWFNKHVWRPAVARAGLPAGRANGMHALRHYFASSLLTEGESIQAVSEWLGHSKVSITLDIYAHLMPKSQTRMRKIIDAALAPAEEGQSRSNRLH